MRVTYEDVDSEILGIAAQGTRMRRRRRRRQTFLQRITHGPRRWVKKHKALTVLLGLVALLLALLLLFLWILDRKLDDVPRFPLDHGDSRPAAGAGQNILVVGVDDGKGTRIREAIEADDWPEGTFRSDAMMVVHIADDWSRAQVVSIPRDSYVDVPGHGRTKINAALSYGGPSLMAQTVEQFTDTRIDHVMLTDFDGFAGITEILGGVMVHIPEESLQHPALQAIFVPGWQLIQGEDALVYVRDRKSLARGDFDRVQRQQNVLRQVVEKASSWSVLANPLTVIDLVAEVTTHLAVDDTMTNARLRELALQARNLRVGDVDFATIPHQGSATIDGASVVRVVPRQVRALFDAIDRDAFLEYVRQNPDAVDRLPSADKVS